MLRTKGREIYEIKRQTLNELRNLEMMKSCWNELRKRTTDWVEIRMTMEDHLTVQRNWNLHPRNSNQDMTRLKDAYQSGEEHHLGNTGQIRQVTASVISAPVIYAACKSSSNTDSTGHPRLQRHPQCPGQLLPL